MDKKFYITTPIYYPSDNFHIGHCYTTIVADAIARYKRLTGYDVFYLTGTDEHGEKIQKRANDAGVTPKEYVDKIVANAKDLWKSLDISYDKFIRTTDEEHVKCVQKIFERLYKQGDIYKGEYKGLYCTPCESFWTETQLINGKCPDCGRDVHEVSEEAYFFKLSKYQDRLVKYYEENPDFIEPESRKNEMINNFLKPGLQDLCVSRTSFDWGIPVDFDSKHVIYVWIDALSNYITNIGYDVNNSSDEFKKLWPADLHLIGKDIIRFHTIYWPIILMALDLPLPKQVFGHPWLLSGDDKMSKSKGNVIYADDLVDEFGVDAVRYFVLHETPFANDGNITRSLLVERINSDLANNLGNLVNRTISMAIKYFDGKVSNKNVVDTMDSDFLSEKNNLKSSVFDKMEKLEIGLAIEDIFTFLRRTNKYIDETTPWALAKEDSKRDRLETVLYNLLDAIRVAAILLQPYMPDTSEKIFKQLGIEDKGYDDIEKNYDYEVGSPEVLFQRIDTK